MNKFNELKELLSKAEQDAVAFYEKGNKAAGNSMQQIKVAASDIRKEVTEKKNETK